MASTSSRLLLVGIALGKVDKANKTTSTDTAKTTLLDAPKAS